MGEYGCYDITKGNRKWKGCKLRMDSDNSPDVRLLEVVKDGFGLKTDADLAAFLGISRTAVHNARSGKGRFGTMQRLKLFDRISFLKFREWVQSLSSDNLANAFERFSKAQAVKIAKERINKGKCQAPDAYLIELMKEYSEDFGTDEKVANFLEINPSAISLIRTGRTTLGPYPRLKILEVVEEKEPKIENFDRKEVERVLGSTEALIEAIEDELERRKQAASRG